MKPAFTRLDLHLMVFHNNPRYLCMVWEHPIQPSRNEHLRPRVRPPWPPPRSKPCRTLRLPLARPQFHSKRYSTNPHIHQFMRPRMRHRAAATPVVVATAQGQAMEEEVDMPTRPLTVVVVAMGLHKWELWLKQPTHSRAWVSTEPRIQRPRTHQRTATPVR